MEVALHAGPLLAAGLLQPLSENSRQAHQLSTATLYPGIGFANSNMATGLHVCLYNDDRQSRYTSKERDSEAGLDYFGVSYTYDAVTNSTGHLTSVSNSNSATNYTSFDPMGRVTASSQVTAGQTYPFTYSYNLSGSLTTESYPSGRTFTTGYDAANHPLSVTGSLNGTTTNFASSATYWPHGALATVTYGNNVVPVYSYNNRLQPSQIYSTIGNNPSNFLIDLTYNWGTTNNNGNLQGGSEGYGASVPYGSLTWLSQTYGYDKVNRLTSVTDTGYTRAFGYDPYGNMYISGAGGITPAGNAPQGSGLYNGNNQLAAGNYDGAGNQTSVNGNTITYDAEGRQTSVSGLGVNETYAYDADGRRVGKVASGGSVTVFVYDALGRLGAEYSTGTESAGCLTCYLSPDHLGTARLITDQEANVIARHDYLPFGEEITANQAGRGAQWGAANDGINQKFTGKERDSESGLDYFGARYYGSALGRFTSPDEPLIYQNPANPQSWNLYSYVRNNPLSNTDPTGNDCVSTSNQTEASVTVTVSSGTCGSDGGTYVAGTVDIGSLTYNGTSVGYSYSPYDTASTVGGGTINIGPAADDSLPPGVAGMLNQAGNMASPFVNFADAGVMAFGGLVAPLPMALAQYGAGNGGKYDLAMAALPELGPLLEGATLARAARGLSAAGIYEKAGGFAQATKDFEALGGAEKTIGPVKVKEFADGTKAVLRDFSKDTRPTLEIQHASGEVTKIRYN